MRTSIENKNHRRTKEVIQREEEEQEKLKRSEEGGKDLRLGRSYERK